MILNYGWFMSGVGNDEEPSGRHVLGYTSLEPLSKNLPVEIKNSEYSKCPAFTKDMKKIFVVKAGFDFEVDIDQVAESWDGSDQGYINRHLSLVNLANDRLIQYTTDLVVFGDQPLNLSIIVDKILLSISSNPYSSTCKAFKACFVISKVIFPFPST